MLKINRHEKIKQLLSENGSLLVSDACEILGCSDQTIRRDFQELEEQGALKRIHGGAFIEAPEDKGVPIHLRSLLLPEEKRHMADITTDRFVGMGDVIMLDHSSTCDTLARRLLESRTAATIITNSVSIAEAFTHASVPGNLIFTGGKYNERSGSFTGSDALRCISSYFADKAFISCSAIDMDHGMLDTNEAHMDIRRAMLDHAKERYLMVDHTKFDDRASYIIGSFNRLSGIITDRKPDEAWCEYFRTNGINVIW